MIAPTYTVTDDSGFLALVDPDSYPSFLSADWTLDQIRRHFVSQMHEKRLVIWGTGREDIWHVKVQFERSAHAGFREFSTFIRASGERLLLTNYESLTMAAQFDDVKLPEPHDLGLLIPVRAGLYCCRVIQRFDPEPWNPTLRDEKADFIIELVSAKEHERVESLDEIPWSKF